MGTSKYLRGGIFESPETPVEQTQTPAADVEETVDFTQPPDLMAKAAKFRGKYSRKTTPDATVPTPLIPPKHPAIQLWESVIANPEFELTAAQISPNYLESLEIPRASIAEIRSYLKTNYEGGQFRLSILQNGVALSDEKGTISVNIPVGPTVKKNGKEEESGGAKELERQEQELKARARVEEAKERLELQQLERDKRRKNPLENKLQELEKKLEDERKERERLQREADRPKENPTSNALMAALIAGLPELIKAWATPKPPDSSAKDLAHAMERMSDKQLQAQKDMLAAVEKMNERTLQTIKETKKEDGLAQYLRMEDSLMARMEKFGAFDKKDEDKGLHLDPQNIFGSLVTSLMEIGYKLVSDPNTGRGIGDALSAIASQIGRPKAQWTTSDIPKIEAWVAQAKQQMTQNPQQLPAPAASQQVASNPPAEFKPEQTAPVESPAPTPVSTTAPVTPQAAAEDLPPTVTPQDKVEDLKESIEMSVRQAILDLEAERPFDSQKWVYDALRGWGPEFLKKFNDCQCWADKEQTQYDIMPRLNLIKAHCDEKLFNQLVAMLAEPKYLELFKHGVTELLTQFNNPETK